MNVSAIRPRDTILTPPGTATDICARKDHSQSMHDEPYSFSATLAVSGSSSTATKEARSRCAERPGECQPCVSSE
jgi:hypothetical protein